MNPLTLALKKKYGALLENRPLLIALLEFGASYAAPTAPKTDRSLRRIQQMRILRQWTRVEKALERFIAAGATDIDILKHTPDADLDFVNGDWRMSCEPTELRMSIAQFLKRAATVTTQSHPFFANGGPKDDEPLKMPPGLEEQFHAVVSQSEPLHTPLDKFLRGSLKASQLLAQLLEHARDPEGEMSQPKTEALLASAEKALVAQGFTR